MRRAGLPPPQGYQRLLGFLGVLAAKDLNAGGAEQYTGGKHGKSLHGRSPLYILQ